MLFVFDYIYNFFNCIKNKIYNYSNNEFTPSRKEQEFINYNIYSKNMMFENDNIV